MALFPPLIFEIFVATLRNYFLKMELCYGKELFVCSTWVSKLYIPALHDTLSQAQPISQSAEYQTVTAFSNDVLLAP